MLVPEQLAIAVQKSRGRKNHETHLAFTFWTKVQLSWFTNPVSPHKSCFKQRSSRKTVTLDR